MTQPFSGNNSVLDNRGISVYGDGFSLFDQMKSALSSKEILRRISGNSIDQMARMINLSHRLAVTGFLPAQ
jgi:hypothetical protein